MIKISKNEAMYLVSKKCRWGEDLHHTYSDGKTYYATESPKVLKIINDYRKSRILEIHE